METLNKPEWTAAGRLLFKFICIYVVLFALPVQLLYQDLIIWFGYQFLGVEGEVSTAGTGSGDKLIHWLTFWFHLIIAFLGTLIWTAIDRNRKSYHRAGEGLYIFVRYYLALVLLMYGIGKIIPLQFSEPSLIRLTQELGDSSPMGLAWTFMGFSTPYQMFAGWMEAIGAALLLFRRTTLAGALVLTAVMTNVFMINMFFDVPVKLNSAHYLLLSIGLVSLHIKPLWDFLIMGRMARKNVRPFPVQDSRWQIISYTIKGILIVGVLIAQIFFMYNQYRSFPEPPEIAGIYQVEEFRLHSIPEALYDIDKDRWSRMVIDNRAAGMVAIDYSTGDRVRFRATISSDSDSISARVPQNPRLEYGSNIGLAAGLMQISENEFLLRGTLGGDSLYVRLNKIDHEELLLVSRGFNWVNEFPFNR
jgi:uncharacterized membrane protein YphA (DoxX/SURF4 family)